MGQLENNEVPLRDFQEFRAHQDRLPGGKIGKRQQSYERCLASAAKLESSAMAAIGRRGGKG
jgi:hypothetical protein